MGKRKETLVYYCKCHITKRIVELHMVRINFLFSFYLHILHRWYYSARGRHLDVCYCSLKIDIGRDLEWGTFMQLQVV